MPEEILAKSEKAKKEEEESRSAKEKIRSRQHDVYVFHLKGLTNKEIAYKLGVSESTVEKDLHNRREEIKPWMDNFRSYGVFCFFRDNYEGIDEVQKEMWRIYHETKDPKLQIKILDSIANNAVKSNHIVKERKNL